jgi:hypothetical protein
MATRAHIVIPTSKEGSYGVIESVKSTLADEFGGVSVYEGSGEWLADGHKVSEPHKRIVVTEPPEYDGRSVKYIVKGEAEYVKSALDEEAVLVEFEDVEMKLI